ncbi:hypothetical protein evm_015032, partial [Chilo suppressalis]
VNLIALKKKDGRIHPTAVGSTFRRIAFKICSHHILPTVSADFQPMQLGFGVKAGCEAAVYALPTYLSLDATEVVLKGLENKIISLQQKLGTALERAKAIDPLQQQIVELRAKLELLKLVEIEAKSLRVGNNDKDSLIAALQAELTSERDSNKRLIEEKKEIEQAYKKEREEWQAESKKLEDELRSNKEHYEMAIEELIKILALHAKFQPDPSSGLGCALIDHYYSQILNRPAWVSNRPIMFESSLDYSRITFSDPDMLIMGPHERYIFSNKKKTPGCLREDFVFS